MKMQLDMDRIARGLGAERRGKVPATGGYFGAMQLVADIEARFCVPAGGGRPTNRYWTERRLVRLAPRTLELLKEITAKIRDWNVSANNSASVLATPQLADPGPRPPAAMAVTTERRSTRVNLRFTRSDRHNLTRLPPEEEAAIRKKLEEEGH